MRGRRGRAVHFEDQVVGVTPPPILARLIGANDGVGGVVVPVGSGMSVRGTVTATHVAAAHAQAQMDPSSPHAEAVLAPFG
jgi:hypothetical protein